MTDRYDNPNDALAVLYGLRLEDGTPWREAATQWQLEDARAVLAPGPDGEQRPDARVELFHLALAPGERDVPGHDGERHRERVSDAVRGVAAREGADA